MNRLLLALGILACIGIASAWFGGSGITMQIFDDSNTTIYTGSGGDSNFTDANFWQLLSTWIPISDDNLNIPNVWAAIDGNKGTGGSSDLNGYWNKAKGDENVNIAIKNAIDSNYLDKNLSNVFEIEFGGTNFKKAGDVNVFTVDTNILCATATSSSATTPFISCFDINAINYLDFARIGKPTKAQFVIFYRTSATINDLPASFGIGFGSSPKWTEALDNPISSSIITLYNSGNPSNSKIATIDLDVDELPTTASYFWIDTNEQRFRNAVGTINITKYYLVLYGLPDMNNANYLQGHPASDFALVGTTGGADLNGYVDKAKFDGNFQAAFDSNFNSAFAGRMPVGDSNLNVPNVWTAIDGNNWKHIDLNGYYTQASGDANINSKIKTQLDSNGFVKDLNGYMNQSKFDSNLSGRFPISDANLSVPNVWTAIDSNNYKHTDLNGYMKQSNFDSNLSGRFPISDANLSVPNVWSAIDGNNFRHVDLNGYWNQAKGDANVFIDANKMIQQAIDRNNWIKHSELPLVDANLSVPNVWSAIDGNKGASILSTNNVWTGTNEFKNDVNVSNKFTTGTATATGLSNGDVNIGGALTVNGNSKLASMTAPSPRLVIDGNLEVSHDSGSNGITEIRLGQLNGTDGYLRIRSLQDAVGGTISSNWNDSGSVAAIPMTTGAPDYAGRYYSQMSFANLTTAAGSYIDFAFGSGTDGLTSKNRFYADGTNGFGTGTTKPNAALTVVGDVNLSAGKIYTGTATTSGMSNGDANFGGLMVAKNIGIGNAKTAGLTATGDLNVGRDVNINGKLKVVGTINGISAIASSQDCGAGQVLQAVNSTGNGTCVANQTGVTIDALCVFRPASGDYHLLDIVNGAVTSEVCFVDSFCLYSCECFLGDTKVKTPSGETNISNLKVGDSVLSMDLNAMKLVSRQITKLEYHASTPKYLLINGFLQVTPNHHVFLNGKEWVAMGEAKVGDYFTSFDGSKVFITSIETKDGTGIPSYNLLLSGNEHTYIADGVVVHNKCPRLDAWIDGKWTEVGRAIYENNGIANRKQWDISLSTPAQKFRIVEDEPEVSHIDWIKGDGMIGIANVQTSPASYLGATDGSTHEFSFTKPVTKIETFGYYDYLGED